MEYSVEGKPRSTAWGCHPHRRHLTDIKARARARYDHPVTHSKTHQSLRKTTMIKKQSLHLPGDSEAHLRWGWWCSLCSPTDGGVAKSPRGTPLQRSVGVWRLPILPCSVGFARRGTGSPIQMPHREIRIAQHCGGQNRQHRERSSP